MVRLMTSRPSNSSPATTSSTRNPVRNTAKTTTTSRKSSSCSALSPRTSASPANGARKSSIARASSGTSTAYGTGLSPTCSRRSITLGLKRRSGLRISCFRCSSYFLLNERMRAGWRTMHSCLRRREWMRWGWISRLAVKGRASRGGRRRSRRRGSAAGGRGCAAGAGGGGVTGVTGG